MNKIKNGLIGVIAFSFASTLHAGIIDLYVGDNDGYGQGIADGGNLTVFGFDNRSAGETASTNGAEQTDLYSANISPQVFDVTFSLAEDLLSAIFELDMGGFQAATFGELSVAFNGISQASLFNVNDGAYGTSIHSFSLNAATLASSNAANELIVTIGRNGSIDGIAYDYFRLSGESDDSTDVPEPGSLALLGLGLAGLGFSRRKSTKA